jgi:perosamine synthetase
MKDTAREILEALQAVLGTDPVGLHEPRLGVIERDAVDSCLKSGFVSSVGPSVGAFEEDVRTYTGAANAVAVSSGTAALHTALLVAGVRTGDEVIVQAVSFVATANAVSYCGASPHFVDIEEVNCGIDPDALRLHLRTIAKRVSGQTFNKQTGSRISAVVVMHTFGHISRMDDLKDVADEFGLVVIEDAAEALGSWAGDRHAGTFAKYSALSFNGNKIITTGGGGMVLLADDSDAHRARHLTTTARTAHAWEFDHDEIGFNYRMPSINAALGRAQMTQLSLFLSSKRALHKAYLRAFATIDGVSLMGDPPGSRSNFWLQTLVLQSGDVRLRDEILELSNRAGIMTRPLWKLLPTIRPYIGAPRTEHPVAESLSSRAINIPSSALLV